MAISMMACKGAAAGLAAERYLANSALGIPDVGSRASCSGQCTKVTGELKGRIGRRSVQASARRFGRPVDSSSRWSVAEICGGGEDEFQQFGGKSVVNFLQNSAVRRPIEVRSCRVSGGLSDLYTPSPPNQLASPSTSDGQNSRVVRASASMEDGVQSPEAAASSDEGRTSTSTADPPTSESPSSSPSNPFAGGKISKIAAKQSGNGDSKQSMSVSVEQKAATPKKPKTPAPGQLSANAATQLKVSRQPSVFKVPTKPTEGIPSSPFAPAGQKKPTPVNPFRKDPLVPADWEKAGARPAGSGKKVLDAFKEGDKIGKATTKFGQPVVPTNIFDEVRRTPEEIAADAFKFEINPGQLLLAGSFVVVIAIMFGTVFLVWRVGAIHYNEL